VALVRERTIPTKRPPLVGEVSVNYFACRGCRVVSATDPHGRILDLQHNLNILRHVDMDIFFLLRSSVVVKALSYKPEGRGFKTR
jgi:hypothetical protein